MFCHNCGFKTDSNYCPECGTKMVESDSEIVQPWRNENDFEKVAKHPEVIELISTHSNIPKKKVNSEYILDKVDLISGAFTGMSSKLICEVALPVYCKLGIKTGKNDKRFFEEPINEVFVKLLCSISANNKLEFNEFYQAKDGLLVISKIKQDFLSFEGNLTIELQQEENGVMANVNATVKGQFYDYGKSKRVISRVLSDLQTIELK